MISRSRGLAFAGRLLVSPRTSRFSRESKRPPIRSAEPPQAALTVDRHPSEVRATGIRSANAIPESSGGRQIRKSGYFAFLRKLRRARTDAAAVPGMARAGPKAGSQYPVQVVARCG